ncbi:MAG: hypothetical protein M1823_003528 [Watsoniomyces obsoletus]|nr:MAG: hypothetical protein M1823_003528 [Watsoniomyces obsoletus]
MTTTDPTPGNMPIQLPLVLQAGGGLLSGVSSSRSVERLSGHMLAHLKNIFDQEIAVNAKDRGNWSGNQGHLNGYRFMLKTQHDQWSSTEQGYKINETWAFNDFLDYVSSPDFSALGPVRDNDLKYPISNYFISSSHNTYLTGHQLYGRSSAEGYTNVLLRGCRCIEIDVWDGQPRDGGEETDDKPSDASAGPVATTTINLDPGNTTPRQTAGEADELSRKRSASTSISPTSRCEPRVLHGVDLPVIVSLEVHASLEQQAMMVEIMREVWAGMLLDDTCKEIEGDGLPSPQNLRKKILVKVRPAAAITTVKEDTSSPARPPVRRIESNTSQSSSDESMSPPDGKKVKKSKILDALGKLGVYTRSYHFSNFDQPEASFPTHIFSLSEKALTDVRETHGQKLFSHNRNFLMRVYPHGFRISSSNLNPVMAWRDGVQMVALNWQSLDKGMALNEGMFARTGGWVLKPPGYRGETLGPNGSRQQQQQQQQQQQDEIPRHSMSRRVLNFVIRIYAAQDLPVPVDPDKLENFRPCVKCRLDLQRYDNSNINPDHSQSPSMKSGAGGGGGGAGGGLDKGNDRAETLTERSKTRKSANPDFEGERLAFKSVEGVIEGLSFLRIKIKDDRRMGRDEMVAWACIRLDRLKSGYRFVRLLDARGQECKGVLLVKIDKEAR